MEYSIKHQDDGAKGAFFIQAGSQRIAELTYTRSSASLINVDHTEVDPSLSGQGVGRKLIGAIVSWVRSNGSKVNPICSFAKSQFDKDESIRDVLS